MTDRHFVSISVLTIILLMVTAFAADSNRPRKNQSSEWRKVVWVDEKGVRHVTLVSPRSSGESTEGQPSQRTTTVLPKIISAKVRRIKGVDGIELVDGRVVKYIGVKAPSTKDPGYKQAEAFHRKMAEGKWVNILPGVEPLASDGSLWGFVFINRMTFINAELIRHGYAKAYPVEPNTQYQILFQHLQNRATKRKLGIWKK